MEDVLIDFKVKNEEILATIDLLEKIGQVEKGTADQFRASAAARKAANDQAEASAIANYEATEKSKQSLQGLSTGLKDIQKTVAGGALDEGMKNLGTAIDKTEGKTRTLKQKLKAMKNELDKTKEGSAQFNELSLAAAKLQDKIGDVAARVRNLASDTKGINALISGMQGVTGAFAVGQGAVALFGEENADMQKTLLKVNAAMAIMQGLQQVQVVLFEESAARSYVASAAQAVYTAAVGTSTGALKAFRIALLATGIGLVIVAIGALIANWDKLTGANNGVIKSEKLLNDSIKNTNDRIAERNSLIDSAAAVEIATLKYNEATKQQIREAEIEALRKHYDTIDGNLTDFTATLTEIQKRGKKEEVEEAEKKYRELIQLRADAQNKIKIAELNSSTEQKAEAKDAADKLTAINKKANDDKTAANKKAAEDQKKIDDDIKKGMEDSFNAFVTDLQNRIAAETAAKATIKSNEKTDSDGRLAYWDAYYEELANKLKLSAATDPTKAATLNLDLLRIEKARLDKELSDVDITEGAKTELKRKAAANNILIAQGEAEQKKAFDKTERESYQKLALDSIAAVRSANQSYLDWEIGELDEQLAKKQISEDQYAKKVKKAKHDAAVADKAFAAFHIVLSTSMAVMAALALIPPNPVLAVAAGITGAAELAAVLSKPIPGFKHGTKSAPSGFKWVGEQGPELIHTPGGDTILPHKKSVAFAQMYFDDERIRDAFPAMPAVFLPQNATYSHDRELIDYNKLGKVIAKEINNKNMPDVVLNLVIDHDRSAYNNQRYTT